MYNATSGLIIRVGQFVGKGRNKSVNYIIILFISVITRNSEHFISFYDAYLKLTDLYISAYYIGLENLSIIIKWLALFALRIIHLVIYDHTFEWF